MFGGVALLGGLLDLRMLVSHPLHARHRLARHPCRMCFARYSATASFFLGLPQVIPEPPGQAVHTGPVGDGLLALAYDSRQSRGRALQAGTGGMDSAQRGQGQLPCRIRNGWIPVRTLGGFIAACLALTGCNSETVSDAIGEQVAGQAVDLRTAHAGDWDRLCLIGPYSNDQAAKEILGFSWPVESRSSIEGNDGISLLLFVREQHVVLAVEHPRARGDFSGLSGRCFAPDQARFVVRTGRADGWPELVPRGGTERGRE